MTSEQIERFHSHFEDAGVPPAYSRQVLRQLWFPELPEDFTLMLIHGSVGTGKTVIATTIMAEIAVAENLPTKPVNVSHYSPHTGGSTSVEHDHAQWIDYTEWIDGLRPRDVPDYERWQEQDRRDALERKATQAEILVLDDLGATRFTDFALEKVAGLLRGRKFRGLRTVVTTNMPPSEIARLDPRLGSRLTGDVVVKREGEDHRVKQATRVGY